jgi:glutaminyl-peptide cyclotransferase
MPKPSSQTIFLATVIAGSCVLGAYLVLTTNGEAAVRPLGLKDIPFKGERAYAYLTDICALGKRPSGSPGMAAQQKLVVEHFEKAGGQVSRQEFRIRHPVDGSAVPMVNLVVQWHPDRSERVLLCCHYDTRPYPDKDRLNPRGTFIGANDGASGVALLMELAHDMPAFRGPLGVDFAIFDGEEFVFQQGDKYFWGSEYFANAYVAEPPAHRYVYGVLVDMIGDRDLKILQERNSISWPETRPLVLEIWKTAKRLGVREFVARPTKTEIRDDHLALRNIAGIPTCDIIDFDYPHWHTEQDTPERCSPLSLAKVGWVLREWLRSANETHAAAAP